MGILKSISENGGDSGQPDRGRRSFIGKVGAGMSALLAVAVPGVAAAGMNSDKNMKTNVDRLSRQVGILEDEKAIHTLHAAYENMLDKGMYNEVPDLFAGDAQVVFNGGIFKGKNKGINRLFTDYFQKGMTGRKMEPAPGFDIDPDSESLMVKVAQDRKSARASFTYSIQVGTPIVSDSSLVKMAQLQGGGIMKWWEGGVCDVSYKKDIKSGDWKIVKLEYNVRAKADYRPGKTSASEISVPLFSKVYPEDPSGPDRLI